MNYYENIARTIQRLSQNTANDLVANGVWSPNFKQNLEDIRRAQVGFHCALLYGEQS